MKTLFERMSEAQGASQATGLGSAKAPEPHSGLRPAGAIPRAAFTAGPWVINPRKPVGRRVFMPDDCIEVAREDGSMVACLYATNASMDGSTDRANARLIASAPTLHDALHQVLLSLIGLHIGTHEASKSAAASIDLGQAALAQARGEQP